MNFLNAALRIARKQQIPRFARNDRAIRVGNDKSLQDGGENHMRRTERLSRGALC